MKKIFALLILLITITAFCSTNILNLSASFKNGMTTIKWNTTDEVQVNQFIVEKSSDGTNFTSFKIVDPKGSNSSYAVIDRNPYRGSYLYYRIRIKDNNGSSNESEIIRTAISTSGISASWGSLKAMFR